MEICSNSPIVVKWSGVLEVAKVKVKALNDSTFKDIINYEIHDNTFSWYANDAELFNVPLVFQISDGENEESIALSPMITIYKKTEVKVMKRSVRICEGENVVLDLETDGYNLSYQWYKDDEPIIGAKSKVLEIPNADYYTSGLYKCEVSSSSTCEPVMSEDISVYVITKTRIMNKPEFYDWHYLGAASLEVKLHAHNERDIENFRFEWYKDTTIYVIDSFYVQDEVQYLIKPIDIKIKLSDNDKFQGTNSQSLTIGKLAWGDRSKYTCIAYGLCGIDSTHAIIDEHNYFHLEKISSDFTDCEGISVTFKAELISSVKGNFQYQWFEASRGKLVEGDHFSGTNTLELTIHNPDARDEGGYFVKVHYPKLGLSSSSELFIYQPETKPTIALQTKSWVINAPRDYYIKQIYLRVSLKNYDTAFYRWYKDGNIIGTGYNIDIRKFPKSKDSAVGWYVCEIINKCGTTWSDSIYVAWGIEDFRRSACMNEQLVVDIEDLGNEYEYEWIFEDKIVTDNHRIINSNTNKLTFLRLLDSDVGNYQVYAVDKDSKLKILLGTIEVRVILPPVLVRDLPDTLQPINGRMPLINMVASSEANGIYHILYIDGKQEYNEQYIDEDEYGNIYHGFNMGGSNSNLKPGVYQYRLRNDCGMTWSNKMTVINDDYVPGGIVPTEDQTISYVVTEKDPVTVYPNPASDFITITELNNGLQPIVQKVQIFDVLGIEVMSVGTGQDQSQQRIDVSHLPAGVYFVKVGNCIVKFVKI